MVLKLVLKLRCKSTFFISAIDPHRIAKDELRTTRQPTLQKKYGCKKSNTHHIPTHFPHRFLWMIQIINPFKPSNPSNPSSSYPLVNIQEAIENGHRNSGFSHSTWWFSIAICRFTSSYPGTSVLKTPSGCVSQIPCPSSPEANPCAIKIAGIVAGIFARWIDTRPGKRLHNELENPPMFNGKTHYFDWAIFNSKLLVYQRVCLMDIFLMDNTKNRWLWYDSVDGCEILLWIFHG